MSLAAGRTQHLIAFEQLDRSGLFDGKFCLWCKGHDEPVARIDPGSRNAPILTSLVAAWIERSEKTAPAQPAGDARAADGQLAGEAAPTGLGKMPATSTGQSGLITG